MNGVIYARYSSDSQTENSVEGQLRECMAFAEKNGITVFSTYIDRAMSAKTDNRPQFQKMIKDSAKGLFDVIIVWKRKFKAEADAGAGRVLDMPVPRHGHHKPRAASKTD